VTINGTDYYLRTTGRFSRYDAKSWCDYYGMKLLKFETIEKWEMITSWLVSNGTNKNIFVSIINFTARKKISNFSDNKKEVY